MILKFPPRDADGLLTLSSSELIFVFSRRLLFGDSNGAHQESSFTENCREWLHSFFSRAFRKIVGRNETNAMSCSDRIKYYLLPNNAAGIKCSF
jgi:hypothetical protein